MKSYDQRWVLRGLALAGVLSGAVVAVAQDGRAVSPEPSGEETARLFATPPASARPWQFWYWLNGNVSREGIIADLEAMQQAGIGGVMQFDVSFAQPGPAPYRSPKWWELWKLAVAEAQKRGIRFSFHCPGWSHSGGPWITPEYGMQELAWSETEVQGPCEFTGTLPRPGARLGYYRDALLVAFPAAPGKEFSLRSVRATLASPTGKSLPPMEKITDNNPETVVSLPPEFDVLLDQAVTVQSVTIRSPQVFQATVSVWDEQLNQWSVVVDKLQSGGMPWTPNVAGTGFAPVHARKFRFRFPSHEGRDVTIDELELSRAYVLPDWHGAAGFGGSHTADGQDLRVKPSGADVIRSAQVLDLTGKMGDDGVVKWSVPPGRWTLLRVGHRPTGSPVQPAPEGGHGLECDKLSKEAADFHYANMVRPALEQLGPELARKALEFYHVDSFEAGPQNWTSRMPQEFRARRGYSLIPFLPALTGRVVDEVMTTDRFLSDYRKTMADLFADNNFKRLRELCRKDGLNFSSECYGGSFDSIQAFGNVDHPMVEFMLEPQKAFDKLPLWHAVAAAHTHGIPVIGAESYTSGYPVERWISHPFYLKPLGDWILCSGINRMVLHVNVHQPSIDEHRQPGLTLGAWGSHFHRGNTWWPQGARPWTEYLTRCQWLLRQGHYVADVLYYNGDGVWGGVQPSAAPLPDGMAADVCDTEVLKLLVVSDGQLTLPSGMRYRYLVLPADKRMTLEAMRKIQALVKAGATVVGRPPEGSRFLSEYPQAAEELPRMVRELWGDQAGGRGIKGSGSGRMVWGQSLGALAANDRVPGDFTYDETSGLSLRYIHRRINDMDVYFVASATPKPGFAECRFRVTGKTPELWRPESGKREVCALYSEAEGVTRVPLQLQPAESLFVVFRSALATPHAAEMAYRDDSEPAASSVKLLNAMYGIPGDAGRTRDVTRQLGAYVRNGRLCKRDFEDLAGDPAPGFVKQLQVRYESDGTIKTVTLKDRELLVLPGPDAGPPGELSVGKDGLRLSAWKAGQYVLRDGTGGERVIAVKSPPPSHELSGPWEVCFPAGWDAPEKVDFPSLISWSEHPDAGVKYFSGTAVYRKDFVLPELTIDDYRLPMESKGSGKSTIKNQQSKIYLDLGRVEVIAEVRLNGKSLGTLWKPPFRVEVTEALKEGANELEVKVTNLWPNRMIGDEQFPDDITPGHEWKGHAEGSPDWALKGLPRPSPQRKCFSAFRCWSKTDPLLPSGLLGPVTLCRPGEVVIDVAPSTPNPFR